MFNGLLQVWRKVAGSKAELVKKKFSSMMGITVYNKTQWQWPWRGKTNSKGTDGVKMTWFFVLLDMGTNGEVWMTSKFLTWEIG